MSPYRRKTLRTLPPEARRLARTIGELDTQVRRLKRLLPVLATAESLARAEPKRYEKFGLCAACHEALYNTPKEDTNA